MSLDTFDILDAGGGTLVISWTYTGTRPQDWRIYLDASSNSGATYTNVADYDVTATLTAVSGLRVVNDPTKLVPNCVYLDAPNFTTAFGNGNIVRLEFPVKVIGSGPAGLPVLRSILSIVASVLNSPIIVMAGRPSSLEIGGALYPCYDLDCAIQAQTA